MKKKKLRRQVIDAMLAGQISVPEARARIASLKTGVYRPPVPDGPHRGAAVKSARPASWQERYYSLSDPVVRERAWEAAQRNMVTKGMTPGAPDPGSVRTVVWAPGPDGSMGWRLVQGAVQAGPPAVPPGIAGR